LHDEVAMRYFSAALTDGVVTTLLGLAILLDTPVVAGADSRRGLLASHEHGPTASPDPAVIVRRDDTTCQETVVVPQVPARWPGKLFVNHDDWALTDLGFARAPDTASFVSNLTGWFAGGTPGR
jgi:hypothetical protein